MTGKTCTENLVGGCICWFQRTFTVLLWAWMYSAATIGIDAWAVDFVLLNTDGKRIGDAVAYRDERHRGCAGSVREALGKEYCLTFSEHRAAFRK